VNGGGALYFTSGLTNYTLTFTFISLTLIIKFAAGSFRTFWWGNLRERDHWGDSGVDGRITLEWIFRKWDVGVWTGLSWLRIEADSGHL
jgi:hypothetical protein